MLFRVACSQKKKKVNRRVLEVLFRVAGGQKKKTAKSRRRGGSRVRLQPTPNLPLTLT